MFFGRPRDEEVTEMQVLHTNEKSKFYGNVPPAVETVESTINNEHNNGNNTVSSSKLERRTGLGDMRLSK